MKPFLKAATLFLLVAQTAAAQSPAESIMGADRLSNIVSLLKGTWMTAAPDHLGGREVMIVLDDELGIGYVDRYQSVKISYEGGYKIDRDCNGTKSDGIYIVTQREEDPCWQILKLNRSNLEFRDRARLATTKLILESR